MNGLVEAVEDRTQHRASARQRFTVLETELQQILTQKDKIERQLEAYRNPPALASAPSQLKGRSAAKNLSGRSSLGLPDFQLSKGPQGSSEAFQKYARQSLFISTCSRQTSASLQTQPAPL